TYYGRGGSGTTVEVGGRVMPGTLGGGYQWVQAPSAPRSLNATAASETSVSVSWVVPADDGDTPITGYLLQWATNSAFTSGLGSVSVTGTSRTVTGLTAGATYYFRVMARNAVTAAAGSTSVASAVDSVKL